MKVGVNVIKVQVRLTEAYVWKSNHNKSDTEGKTATALDRYCVLVTTQMDEKGVDLQTNRHERILEGKKIIRKPLGCLVYQLKW